MKGLYLNVPQAEAGIRSRARRLGVEPILTRLDLPGWGDLVVYTDPADWTPGPVWVSPEGDLRAAASGWLVFDGRWGDLAGLARAFADAQGDAGREAVLGRIEAGAYVVVLQARGRRWVISDPFGLHPHYHGPEGPLSRLAPGPAFLGLPTRPEPVQARILSKVHYLFGNDTLYQGIRRLGPGLLVGDGTARAWFDWRGTPGGPAAILGALETFLDQATRRPRILPLSGGLDSRLMLALRRFDFGYTYGPPDTGDRPVARQFGDRFDQAFQEFSLLDLTYPQSLREVGREIFDGICDTPFVELLGVYRHVWSRWGNGVLFDGYAGDVLQRGTLLARPGTRGRLAKLWPQLTLQGLRGADFVRARYPGLDDEEATVLAEVWSSEMEGLDLDEAHKVLLFEILHGRGARHALNGGTTMAGQYFTVTQPFYAPGVFRAFFGESAERLLTYRTLSELWRMLPPRFSAPTPTGLAPGRPGPLARWGMLGFNRLGKWGLHARNRDYGSEVGRIRWESPD